MAEKKIPMRTCMSCRQEFAKKNMLRIVKNKDGLIRLDKTGKLDGRGAYVCNSEACIKKLNKAKLLDKTFGESVSEEIYRQIEEDFFGNEK